MKRSIRWKFTCIFAGLMALAIVITWSINTFWLGDYYLRYKVGILEQAYTSIDQMLQAERARETGETDKDKSQESITDVINQLRDTSNITLLVYDSINGKTLVSSDRDFNVLQQRVSHYILGFSNPKREIIKEYDNYTIQKTFDPRSETSFLESWGFFSDNGTIFIMTTPLASIQEGASISNRFLMYVGLAVILVGSIFIYFIMKRITAPIYDLSRLSEKMSNLDFEARYEEQKHSPEEIDKLGNSMNVLSSRLEDTITQLKSANQELQKDIEEKIQIDEMRKDFIANVSHELKTPIALIQGYAEGLTEGLAQDPESRDYYCEVIVDEANKMNKMVRQLLTLTALEFGNEQPSRETFDLTELIQGVISSMRLLLSQEQIQVEFHQTEPVWVIGDEFKIEEVITNYMSNAVHHAAGEKLIRIVVAPEADLVRVSVFNTGNPIPEPELPNLWTKFYKVDKARTRDYGGSGIGLSIVKAIVEAHRQSCGVTNREDGVEFWFTMERVEES